MDSRRNPVVGILAALPLFLSSTAKADPPRGPLVPKNPNAVSCTHPTTDLAGQVTLDPDCIYEQSFSIKTSNTTLDCQGAQIVSTDSYLVNVAGEIENVTVTNCYLIGGKGAAVRTSKKKDGETDDEVRERSPRNVVFSNLHISRSTNVGMYVHQHVVGATIKDSVIVDNSSAGVYLSPYGQQNLVQNNLIQGNGHVKPDGVPRVGWYRREGVAIDGSSHHVIESNHFDSNAFGGVLLYKNCWEHHASDPESKPRVEHAHSNVIRNNLFTNMPFGVWVAARQSRDLAEMGCGDPTPYKNPIVLLNFFHSSYASYSSSYASFYLPWVSVWPDFAEKTTVDGNVFGGIELGAVRVEDDEATVTNNLFLGDFDYVFVGAPFRAKLADVPVRDTLIANNSFHSSVASSFDQRLALIPKEHEGTVLSNNFRACLTPWDTWVHHGASVSAYQPDGTAPGGCKQEDRTCNDGQLDGSFVDEVCHPAPQSDAGASIDASPPDGGDGQAPWDAAEHDAEFAPDAGAGLDSGAGGGGPASTVVSSPASSSDGGCRMAPGTSPKGSWLAALMLAALWLRRRGSAGSRVVGAK
jgi:MYXO-CTERM domain-containing protein